MFLNKRYFQKAANEAAERERRKGSWKVYEEYEVRHTESGEAYVQAATGGTGDYNEYSPLVSHPGLFLKFARLTEEGGITEETWKEWVEGFGVLGLEQHDTIRDVVERHRELGSSVHELSAELEGLDGLGRDYKLYSGSAFGGLRESCKGFEREAYKANRLLRIHEAATARDDLGNDRPNLAAVERYAKEEGFGRRIVTVREAKGWALGFVGFAVQEIISEDCYPLLHQEGFEITQGWGFHTLLGAMYLQMAWLMTAKDEVRCKWCGRVIAFEQPKISSDDVDQRGYRKPYKTRADKVFCKRRCKNRWYYEHTTKLKRKSERP